VRLLERAALDGHTAVRTDVVLAALDRGSVDDALSAGRVVDAGGLLALEGLATAEEGVAVELQGLAAEGRVAVVLGVVPDGADAFVVDRVDRRPLDELAGLLQSVPEDVPVLLAGDPDRLPGPHPGAVLRDLLAWGEVEVRDLRPATTGPGTLGRLAAAVRAGQLPPADPADRSLVVVACADDATVLRRARQLVSDSIPRSFGVAAADIAVLAPLHRGDAGSRALAAALDGTGASVFGLHEAAWATQRWAAVVGCFGAETAGVVSRAMVYELALLATTHLSVVTAVGPALPEAVATGVTPQRVTLLAGMLAEG
jgi:hypothetical protein